MRKFAAGWSTYVRFLVTRPFGRKLPTGCRSTKPVGRIKQPRFPHRSRISPTLVVRMDIVTLLTAYLRPASQVTTHIPISAVLMRWGMFPGYLNIRRQMTDR